MKLYQNIFRYLIVVCLALTLCITTVACGETFLTSKQISPTELSELIETDAVPIILDVRTAEEYSEGHIPGAINIEYRELPSRLDEISSLGKKQIVVYCERGVRATIAEDTLKQAGFEEVLHLEGDISAWREKELKMSNKQNK